MRNEVGFSAGVAGGEVDDIFPERCAFEVETWEYTKPKLHLATHNQA